MKIERNVKLPLNNMVNWQEIEKNAKFLLNNMESCYQGLKYALSGHLLILARDIDFWREWLNMLTPCYTYITLIMTKINIVDHILNIRIFFMWSKRVSSSEHRVQISGY